MYIYNNLQVRAKAIYQVGGKMIVDSIRNMAKYETIVPGLLEAINVIEVLEQHEVGRYELDRGFYMIQKGKTNPLGESQFEAHERYIDVQIMVSGEEIVEWARIEDLTVTQAYDEEKDFKLCKGQGARVEIKAGMCYVLLPEDAHKPCCHITDQMSYTKIVIKLPI